MHRHHRHFHRRIRTAAGWFLGAVAVGIAAFIAMFGGGGGTSDAPAPPRPNRIGTEQSLDFSLNKGALPSVYVERASEGRWTYTYHMQGEEYREQDFLGLCRTLSQNSPDMVVHLVPHTAMSDDEIGLITARIRESGLTNIRVARTLNSSDLR